MSPARARPLSFIAALGYESMPTPRVAASLADAGYDAVEWTMAHVDRILAPASALACQQDLVSGGEAAVDRSLAAVEAAAAAGVPVVDVLTGPNLWEEGAVRGGDEVSWSTALRGLERICERGEQLGVAIGFEPCWGTLAEDAEGAERVLATVPVGVTFDPSHFVMSGDEIPALVRRWGARIVNVHLKDAFGRRGLEGEDFHFCLLGEGMVPWAQFFATLDEVGYAGPMAVEFEAYRYYEQVLGGDPGAAARLAATQVEALLAPGGAGA
ncbi:MAG: sugar phosphate isomerase/epimerase [Solirubrobacterales bacterium]